MFTKNKFKNQKACVLGMGKSGRAVAVLLHTQGFKVLLSEEALIAHVDSFGLPPGIETETGGHSERIFDCDFVVKSPGVLPKHPVLLECKKRGILVFSELEVALSFVPKTAYVLGVTGTNGKTTTTTLVGEILHQHVLKTASKQQVFVTGNIGRPVSTVATEVKKGDFLVIEVSSYQLEDSTYFRPHCACILNITPDHLDHHGGLKNYVKAKAKIVKRQRESDVIVVNSADEACAKIAQQAKGRVLAFATTPNHLLKADVFFDGDEMIFSEGHRIRPPKLKGIHNIENAMCAALMTLSVGVDVATIQGVFDGFEGMEHRIEQFAYHRGVIYVNDSKATNIDSTITALKSFEPSRNIWLILGGKDKGSSYSQLVPYLQRTCKQILSIGSCMDKIERELDGAFPIHRCGDLQQAVDYVFDHAGKGDVVLLSPACASFDQFTDFEHRGKVFKQIVNDRILKERTSLT